MDYGKVVKVYDMKLTAAQDDLNKARERLRSDLRSLANQINTELDRGYVISSTAWFALQQFDDIARDYADYRRAIALRDELECVTDWLNE